MSTSAAQIVSYLHERKHRQPHWIDLARAEEVKELYNGDMVVPLPELDKHERVSVANLLNQGIDQLGSRIGSTQPNVIFPPLRPNSKSSETKASQRKQAMLSMWTANRMKIKDRRRARHMVGYGATPVLIRPNFQRNMSEWVLQSPLSTFPSPMTDPDDFCPDDCLFTFRRPLIWIKQNYPEAAAQIYKGLNNAYNSPTDMYEMVQYVDAEESVMVLLGQAKSAYESDTVRGAEVLELERIENRMGVCPAVTPGRVSLDRIQGQFTGLIGMFWKQAKLEALAEHATEQGVFADQWFVARPGETPRVLQEADGRRGIYGIVQGADLKEHRTDPGYMTNPMIDRLAREQRVEGGIPAEFGGESGSNIRTGKRGEQIQTAVVEFPIQEAQEMLAEARVEEDKRAIAIDKTYFNRPKTFYVGWKGAHGRVDYKPSELWETDEHYVAYSHAGTDINGLAIAVGQRIGTGTLSKKTGMLMDPLVEDAEMEHDYIIQEGLEQALLQALQNQAQQPGANVADYARIMQLVKSNQEELAEAILKVQAEAQERQATSGVPGEPDGPVDPLSPEAQPGLAAPGMGAEAGSPIPGLGEGPQDLASLLGSLRMPQMQLRSERGAA